MCVGESVCERESECMRERESDRKREIERVRLGKWITQKDYTNSDLLFVTTLIVCWDGNNCLLGWYSLIPSPSTYTCSMLP